MSLTGKLYKVNKQDLDSFLKSKSIELLNTNDSLDVSYLLIDLLEILKENTEFDRKEVGAILEGKHSLEKEDGYLGYSFPDEVVELKNEIIDTVNLEKFDLIIALNINQQGSFVNTYKNDTEYLKAIVKYYKNISDFYSHATKEQKGIIYNIG